MLMLTSFLAIFFFFKVYYIKDAKADVTRRTFQVYTGKFHPGGDILASSGFDRQIFLWKVYGE